MVVVLVVLGVVVKVKGVVVVVIQDSIIILIISPFESHIALKHVPFPSVVS